MRLFQLTNRRKGNIIILKIRKDYTLTILTFVVALLLSLVICVLPLFAYSAYKVFGNISGENGFWLGLISLNLALILFIIITPLLIFFSVKWRLNRVSALQAKETAIFCVALLPFVLFVFTVPFIPLVGRYLALRLSKKQSIYILIPIAVCVFAIGIVAYGFYTHSQENKNISKNYSNIDLERDRLLGSRYKLVSTTHNAGSANTVYKYETSQTYVSLVSTLESGLQMHGYKLQTIQDTGGSYNTTSCKREPATSMIWECIFMATNSKYSATFYLTVPGSALPAAGNKLWTYGENHSETPSLTAESPVTSFSLALWNQTTQP